MSERKPYVPERRLDEHHVKKVGVGVFLVDLKTGLVCTVLEKNAKESTGRKAGDISILLETRKQNETVMNNVVGAMEEVRPLQGEEQLVWLDGLSYKGRYPLKPSVLGDLCVVGLENRQVAVDEFVCSEVTSGGWWRLEDLVETPHLRSGVKQFIELALEHRWIEEFISEAQSASRTLRRHTRDEVSSYLYARQFMLDWAGKHYE